MKKSILGIIAGTMLTCSLFASAVPVKIQNEIKNLTFIKKAGFKVQKIKTVGDTYVLKATHPRMPKAILFVSHDMKVIIVGAGFKANGEKIDFPVHFKKYAKDAAYTYGNGTKDYYVFTDPECPYCQMFEKNLKNLKKDAKLHVFLYPLPFHKHAIAMSKYILSQKTGAKRAAAIAAIAQGDMDYKMATYSQEENKKFEDILKLHHEIADMAGVRGTPTVYTQDGKQISWPELLTKTPTK